MSVKVLPSSILNTPHRLWNASLSRAGEHTAIAALAGLDGDDFPLLSLVNATENARLLQALPRHCVCALR